MAIRRSTPRRRRTRGGFGRSFGIIVLAVAVCVLIALNVMIWQNMNMDGGGDVVSVAFIVLVSVLLVLPVVLMAYAVVLLSRVASAVQRIERRQAEQAEPASVEDDIPLI